MRITVCPIDRFSFAAGAECNSSSLIQLYNLLFPLSSLDCLHCFDLPPCFFFTLNIMKAAQTQWRYSQTIKGKKLPTQPWAPCSSLQARTSNGFHHSHRVFQFHHAYMFSRWNLSAEIAHCNCRARRESDSMLLLMLPPALMRPFLPFLLFNVTLERFHHFISATERLERGGWKERMWACLSVSDQLAASDLLL